MIIFRAKHPQFSFESLGFLPLMFDERDPRSAAEQLNANYAHGGGYDPQPGFTMAKDGTLTYPGDPPMPPLAVAELHDELLMFYECEYLAIVQNDGSFAVTRVD